MIARFNHKGKIVLTPEDDSEEYSLAYWAGTHPQNPGIVLPHGLFERVSLKRREASSACEAAKPI